MENLIAELLGNYFYQLYEILRKEAQKYFSTKDNSIFFTSHDMKHSDRVSQNIVSITSGRIDLKQEELFVLFCSALYHDLAIASPDEVLSKSQNERGYYEADLRKNHGDYSAHFIRNQLIPMLFDYKSKFRFIFRENSDLLEGIAKICEYHTAIYDSRIDLIPPSKRLKRIDLLANIFILADNLDLGFTRIDIQKVLNSTISYSLKEKWILDALITGFNIFNDKLVIFVFKPEDFIFAQFKKLIINPLNRDLKTFLYRINKIFKKYRIRNLSVVIEITSSIDDTIQIDEAIISVIKQLSEKLKLENRIDQRLKKWQKLIDSKTIEKGVLEKDSISDEFHVFRRWGSSTHRLFANRKGLQKGGGYFLSWNGIGLVIDPGYDFISNVFSMRTLQFTTKDFNAIYVSHAHDDHTHDLEPIVSLAYRQRKKDKKIKDTKEYDLPIISSEGVRWKFSPIIASNDFVKFFPIIPTKNGKREPHEQPNDSTSIPLFQNYNIKIVSMLSFHGEAPWHLNNTGLATKIYLNEKFCIGYTGDTSYNYELVDFFKDANLMVLHLGNLSNKKLKKDHPNYYYPPHHLGLGGCIDLITHLKYYTPELFIIGEFGADEFITANNNNDRIQITQHIENRSGASNFKKKVLPGDIGLRIRIPDLKVFCEIDPIRYRPTSDNPNGSWLNPLDVIPVYINPHEIHYKY